MKSDMYNFVYDLYGYIFQYLYMEDVFHMKELFLFLWIFCYIRVNRKCEEDEMK